MQNQLSACNLCPRLCFVDRSAGQRGICGQTDMPVIARAALHQWEEPCISGTNGSGAVFFSGCPLHCVFCQNRDIAAGNAGLPVTVERLADIFLELQEKGAHNLNLVTPTHFILPIIRAFELASGRGFKLPVIYNTSGYERAESLRLLQGIVDIYLPDMKYMDGRLSRRYSHAPDYFARASEALAEMVRQVGEPVFDEDGEDGLMKRGVIVRHLALPGYAEDSRQILRYLHETYENRIFISIMNQYTPLTGLEDYPEINRKLSQEEYDELVDYAVSIGIENGFIQEGETADESFIPAFDGEGVRVK